MDGLTTRDLIRWARLIVRRIDRADVARDWATALVFHPHLCAVYHELMRELARREADA